MAAAFATSILPISRLGLWRSQPIRQPTSQVFLLHLMGRSIHVGQPRQSFSIMAQQSATAPPPQYRLRQGTTSELLLPTSAAQVRAPPTISGLWLPIAPAPGKAPTKRLVRLPRPVSRS